MCGDIMNILAHFTTFKLKNRNLKINLIQFTLSIIYFSCFNDILRKVEMKWYEIRKILMLTILRKSKKEYLVNIKKNHGFIWNI